ncbi:Protein kinase domain-containing protein [Cladophialophora immunda]|nr:Protein kinase domain-containing protein [Cladophialophora immunda]
MQEANMTQNTTRKEVKTTATDIPTVTIRTPTFPDMEHARTLPFLTDHLSPTLPFERASSSSRSPPPSVASEKLMDDILPHKISAKVTLTWERHSWKDETIFDEFSWTDKDQYADLLPTKMREKCTRAKRELDGNKVYHRHGSCRIIASTELTPDMPYCILDNDEIATLTDNVIILICGFINTHPHRKFSLEICWDYGYARVTPEPEPDAGPKRTYHAMIKTELGKKENTNFRNQDYIPRRDQMVFQDYDVVKDLVFLDKSLKKQSAKKKSDMVKDIIQLPALKLLLICVYAGHDMAYLQHLLEHHGCSDENPPEPMVCSVDYCRDNVIEISRHKAKFYVKNIDEDFRHHELKISEVMPLRHTRPESERLGTGTSGKVYKVWIDPAHHYLDGDPLCCFAVKVFSSEREKQFRQERAMLKMLADYPHHYIVPHITSWTQSKEHFILYPAARYNLKTFMTNVWPVDFTQHGTLWFLRQLQGLALAIAHVHNLKHPTNSEPDPEVDAYWGCHFDIKPENILVFEKVPGYHPRFKIGDFGAGVFNAPAKEGEHSRLTEEPKGTETYFAPDKDRDGKVSRPFDMWALGCVYLELMDWLFHNFESSEGQPSKTFSTQRFDCSAASDKNRNDRFWYRTSTRQGKVEYKLKPVVENKITELKNHSCHEMPAFQGVVTAISKLLEIEAGDRWTAEMLKSHMTAVVREAEKTLTASPDFYLSQSEANGFKRPGRGSALHNDGRAVTGPQSASASASALAVPNGDTTQEGERTPGTRRSSLSARAAEATILTGSGTDASPEASRDRDNQDTDAPNAVTSRIVDPLAQELSEMAESSSSSPTQPQEPPLVTVIAEEKPTSQMSNPSLIHDAALGQNYPEAVA